MVNSLVLEYHWSFKQAANSTISDTKSLFEGAEFKRYKENEQRKFEALLKTIAKTRL
ncbi:hypothetical protein [Avibacterium paragallinarum]|uniref:Uncharacterized protein n=1 Tax=Avibacterium paragallinarum TaxID=728 RepID=A0A377IWK9_AVIPA|nr:hypothetical protein [Avibacterium paragallinarum]STO91897.1 Uncharacterised protein [Avibacterium paragallinarum]